MPPENALSNGRNPALLAMMTSSRATRFREGVAKGAADDALAALMAIGHGGIQHVAAARQRPGDRCRVQVIGAFVVTPG
ncbi:MAG TPA: hypothetical protein VGQ10_20485 [Vicinamibacterales bacterium]|nr:hypothetical protein [Vicinamibacterales bacterium]